MDEARFLRRELDRIGTRRGPCVPRELKARVKAWIAKQRAAGRKVAELAVELGVAPATIHRWSNGVRAIVPVRVVPDESPAAVAVVSPSGFRIEGLALVDAIRALRELG